MVSNRCAVRCALSCIEAATWRASDAREAKATSSRMGMATSGTSTSQPPTRAITSKNSSRNGRSPSVVRVVEAKNSRTDSKSRTVLARVPPDAGRLAARRRRHWAKMFDDSATSMRRDAVSTSSPRSRRMASSKPVSTTTAMVSTHRLDVALFGITRSYTAIA